MKTFAFLAGLVIVAAPFGLRAAHAKIVRDWYNAT